jgi:uncharacterized membrane protein YkgB
MDNDFDILRNKWKAADCSTQSNQNDNDALIDKLRSQRGESLLKKIERTYIISLIIGAIVLPVFSFTLLDVINPSLFMRVSYCSFGVLMAVLSFFMIRRVRKCDYSQMSVSEAVAAAKTLYCYHIVMFVLGCLLGLAVLLMLYYELDKENDIYFIWGFIAGVAIGLPIGIAKERCTYLHFKNLKHLFDEN